MQGFQKWPRHGPSDTQVQGQSKKIMPNGPELFASNVLWFKEALLGWHSGDHYLLGFFSINALLS